MERNILEDKIERARYCYVVTRKQYYQDLIKEMELMIANLDSKISTTNNMLDNVLKVNVDNTFMYDRLYDIINNSMVIDGGAVRKKEPPLKRQEFSFEEEK